MTCMNYFFLLYLVDAIHISLPIGLKVKYGVCWCRCTYKIPINGVNQTLIQQIIDNGDAEHSSVAHDTDSKSARFPDAKYYTLEDGYLRCNARCGFISPKTSWGKFNTISHVSEAEHKKKWQVPAPIANKPNHTVDGHYAERILGGFPSKGQLVILGSVDKSHMTKAQ